MSKMTQQEAEGQEGYSQIGRAKRLSEA